MTPNYCRPSDGRTPVRFHSSIFVRRPELDYWSVEGRIEKGSAELPCKRRWASLGSYGMSSFMSSFSPSIKKSRYINGFTSSVNVFSSFSRLLTCLQCGLQERTSDQLFSKSLCIPDSSYRALCCPSLFFVFSVDCGFGDDRSKIGTELGSVFSTWVIIP